MPHGTATILLAALGAIAASVATSPSPVAAAPRRVVYPPDGAAWPTARPEAHGLSTARLAQARDRMRTTRGEPLKDVHGIVIRNGHDVWRFGEPYRLMPGLPVQNDWASCGRSLMTTMFGMVFHEQGAELTLLDRPARDVFKDSGVAAALAPEITVRHLLGYASCAKPSGSGWQYGCNYFAMWKILRDIDGQAPAQRLAALGRAIGARWTTFDWWGHGQDVPFLTVTSTAADAARWGYLWLHQGRWRDRQIVPAAFVAETLKPVVRPDGKGFAHSNEGLQIHLNANGMWGDRIPRDAYAALGAGGRIIFVAPSLDLVVALMLDRGPYEKELVAGEQWRPLQPVIEPIIDALVDAATPAAATVETTAHRFEERDGIVSIEAENYSSKRAGGVPGDPRAWYVVSARSTPAVKPDADGPHLVARSERQRASAGGYLEALPDKRTEDHPPNDLHGFIKEPGRGPVTSYRVRFTTPGTYVAYVRAFSTSSADESAHLGIDGTWPTTGANLMWCSGQARKAAGGPFWFWSSHRRENPKTGCGTWNLATVEVKTPGEHTIELSMREDGSEIDKLVLLHASKAVPPADQSPTLGVWGALGPPETAARGAVRRGRRP